MRRPAAVRAFPLTRAVRLLPRRYGRVFTAWGLGGILAPWLAGRLYDATGGYAASVISAIIDSGLPVFGICIGHQLMALAMGASTTKMERGHRGANHPVKDLATGRIEITSQNHGFVVDPDSLPNTLEVTHLSLFDGSVEGLRHREKPAFCVQYHPESSPGPHDSRYLFDRFTALMEERKG